MSTQFRGERGTENKGFTELAARFEVIPQRAHDKMVERMQGLVDRLQARARAAAPLGKTGKLRASITGRVYSDTGSRIAGYVSIYAPDDPKKEYPKAATWEYGTSKPRKMREEHFSAKLGRMSKRRLVARITKPVTIVARRYLRGTLEDMRPEIEAELAAALAESVEEGGR
jgi:hypothetical protein